MIINDIFEFWTLKKALKPQNTPLFLALRRTSLHCTKCLCHIETKLGAFGVGSSFPAESC
jgi:hypothetical protein